MKLIKTDLIYDLLEDPTLSKEAREFFEHLLNNPNEIEQANKLIEDNELIAKVGVLMADFMEELGKEEGIEILKSLCKARTEEEVKEVLKAIQEKMELYTAECKGEG